MQLSNSWSLRKNVPNILIEACLLPTVGTFGKTALKYRARFDGSIPLVVTEQTKAYCDSPTSSDYGGSVLKVDAWHYWKEVLKRLSHPRNQSYRDLSLRAQRRNNDPIPPLYLLSTFEQQLSPSNPKQNPKNYDVTLELWQLVVDAFKIELLVIDNRFETPPRQKHYRNAYARGDHGRK
ncbi:hypothetical protein G7Y89_g983 [Cudoniella acicularis]|uniref:Uncharacterized protein n=1 Tax=Cudoniella acicularis TaxID=354080 RepID=A0A8H4RXS9_9HELO|nr:hypothetical protein G7Y89_g983 [Cudoniella acicularis]